MTIFGYRCRLTIERRKGDTVQRSSGTLKSPLECSIKKPYWISWYKGQVRAGEGHRYLERLTSSMESGDNYPVNALGIANTDTGPAELVMEMDPGETSEPTHPNSSSLRRRHHVGISVFKKAICALLPHKVHFLRILSSHRD